MEFSRPENNTAKAMKVFLTMVDSKWLTINYLRVSNKIFKDSDLQSDLREDLKLVPSTVSAKIQELELIEPLSSKLYIYTEPASAERGEDTH